MNSYLYIFLYLSISAICLRILWLYFPKLFSKSKEAEIFKFALGQEVCYRLKDTVLLFLVNDTPPVYVLPDRGRGRITRCVKNYYDRGTVDAYEINYCGYWIPEDYLIENDYWIIRDLEPLKYL